MLEWWGLIIIQIHSSTRRDSPYLWLSPSRRNEIGIAVNVIETPIPNINLCVVLLLLLLVFIEHDSVCTVLKLKPLAFLPGGLLRRCGWPLDLLSLVWLARKH